VKKMAKVKAVGNTILLKCDCGVSHIISIDAKDNLILDSTFKKADKEPEKKVDEKVNDEPKSIFDLLKGGD